MLGIKSPKPGHFFPFQRVCAGNFTPANSVPAVDSSTHVLSAVPHIPQLSVRPSPVSSMHSQWETTGKDPLHLNCGPTPVNPHGLEPLLRGYDPALVTYLVNGFRFGFSIRYFGDKVTFRSKNFENPWEVTDKLNKEVLLGRIIGPLGVRPFDNLRISPLGLVPKKAPGEFRLIHHLPFPEGSSVNDGIPRELASVHYATMDDAIKKISSLGAGCFLAKTDIKSAFRIIPLHPRDFDLLGLECEGKFYFDRCLPMGCLSLCNIFDTFSTALEWIATTKLQASAVIHILDDFLFFSTLARQVS